MRSRISAAIKGAAGTVQFREGLQTALRSENQTAFSAVGSTENDPQASASWRWWSYLHAQVPSGKRPLRVNIDETALCLFQGGGKGTVFVSKAIQRASLSKRRTYLTHVGVVCDQPHLQRILPQFIVGNLRALPARAMMRLHAARPGNVYLLRRDSSWVNQGLFATIIRLIMAALRPYLDEYQVILMFDTYKAHITSCIFSECARAGAWPLLVPPSMTWLLQVLDTHAFGRYKACLQGAYQDAAATGAVNIDRFLQCVYGAIEEAMQARTWALAFDENGFGAAQGRLSRTVRRHLELEDVAAVSACRPSLEELRLCFPRNADVPDVVLARMAAPAPPARAAPAAASPAPLPAPGRPTTRSMTAAAAVASSSAAPPRVIPVVAARRLLPRRCAPP